MTSDNPVPALHLSRKMMAQKVLDMVAETISKDSRWAPIEFYRTACRLASAAVWAEGASIFLTDSSRRRAILIASHDESDIKIPGRLFEAGHGVAGTSIQTKRIEIHSTVIPHHAFVPSKSKPEIRAVIAAPMLDDAHQVMGVLCVHNPIDSDEFDDESVELIEEYTGALRRGIMIVRSAETLYESSSRLRAEAERDALLLDAALGVIEGKNRGTLADDITRALSRMYKIEHAGLYLKHADGLVLESSYRFPRDRGWIIECGDDDPEEHLSRNVVSAWRDGRLAKLDTERERISFEQPNRFVSSISFPIMHADRPIGIFQILVGMEDGRVLTDKEMARIQSMLSQIARLLERIVV